MYKRQAYAVVSYQTAWLRCYYPVEFMAALLTSVITNPKKITEYINTCRVMGISILPPDINEGEAGFSVACLLYTSTLAEEKLIDEDTVVDLLKNNVVLITPKDSKLGIKSFKDITKADTIAIGDPESVPAGKYAKEILTNLGVYNEVDKKASLGASVTEVLSWVAEGSADAGIVYATDAQTENTNGDDKEVEVGATAEDSMMQTQVVYPVGVVSASTHKDEAKAFEDFLQTDEAKVILEKAGFTINK